MSILSSIIPYNPLQGWLLGTDDPWSRQYRTLDKQIATNFKHALRDYYTQLQVPGLLPFGQGGAGRSPSSHGTPSIQSTENDLPRALPLTRPIESVIEAEGIINKIIDLSIEPESRDLPCLGDGNNIPNSHMMSPTFLHTITKASGKRRAESPGPVSSEQKQPKRQAVQANIFWGCPFSKHNPERYEYVYNSCTRRPGIPTLKRIMEHLRKVHSSQMWCESCLKRFPNPDDKNSHISSGPCKKKDVTNTEPERMTPDQERIFNTGINDRRTEGEDVWRCVFQSLFPDDVAGKTMSPYYDYCIPKHQLQKNRSTGRDDGSPVILRTSDDSSSEPRTSEDMPALVRGISPSTASLQDSLQHDSISDLQSGVRNSAAALGLSINGPPVASTLSVTRPVKVPPMAEKTMIFEDPEDYFEQYISSDLWE